MSRGAPVGGARAVANRDAPFLHNREDTTMTHQVPAADVGMITHVAPDPGGSEERPAIVLVHGGFVDGSGWQGVYQLLRRDGYTVRVVQNPTTSLNDDVGGSPRWGRRALSVAAMFAGA